MVQFFLLSFVSNLDIAFNSKLAVGCSENKKIYFVHVPRTSKMGKFQEAAFLGSKSEDARDTINGYLEF